MKYRRLILNKEYSIRTFESKDKYYDLKYTDQKVTKIITDDLASELEKLVNKNTRSVKIKILRQYADELKVNV